MNWLQKMVIGLVAFLTLGIITPTHDIWNHLQDKNHEKAIGPSTEAKTQVLNIEQEIDDEEESTIADVFIVKAHDLAYEKFGTKIGPVIGEEFDETIFPKMNQVIHETLNSVDNLHNGHISISERPAGNYSEKIFNLYNEDMKKDLVRFHVRTDKRPQEGYYFNFHYHKEDDAYVKHYKLGEIFWSKDTPPKWLS